MYLWSDRSFSKTFRSESMSAHASDQRASIKQIIGWAFCMVIFPVIPLSTVFILEPSWVHIVLLAIGIGSLAGIVGRTFAD